MKTTRRDFVRQVIVGSSAIALSSKLNLIADTNSESKRKKESDNYSHSWPVLKHYDQNHLARIALPLGGIGTGTVSLGGRGDLRDWEIMNIPAKGFVPKPSPFFAIYVKRKNGNSVVKALEGPLENHEYEGQNGSQEPNHGLPRFNNCSFDATYPFGIVNLSDSDVPVDISLEAFNPFIPGDTDTSGIPVAILRYKLTNKTKQAVKVSVCGNLPNFIGNDGSSIINQIGLAFQDLSVKKKMSILFAPVKMFKVFI